MKITQLDLFSGIGGFHLGFERAGYEVTSFFSEIDKHAIAVYKHQFPNSTYVGSVTNVRGSELPRIDLITFGSPCQDFSLAGKRLGMEGQRSSLILEAIRLIHECRPRVFVWENVKGTFSSNNGADFWAIIQAFANIGGYRLEWQLLNTSWFLPQNRERIYLVGYSTTTGGDWKGIFPIGEGSKLFNSKKRNEGQESTSVQNEDNIARALNSRPAFGQGSEDTFIKVIDKRGNDKQGTNASTLVAGYYKQPSDADYIKVKQVGTRLDSNGGTQPYQQDRVYDADGIVPALNQGKSDLILRVKSATSQGYEIAEQGDSINLSQPNSETRRGRVGKQKAQTLETSCNQAVVQPNYTYEKVNETIRRNEFVEGEVKAMDLYNKTLRDQSPALTQPEHNGISLFDGYRIRRLTPIECERLQGFPDNHTAFGNYDGEVKPMSNTQRYKQCGNAVTVDVVQAVANQCKPLFK
jgi:DNA (cytosine-5)-methyltransferase 1